MWNIDLSGTIAVITGASRGIGKAIALGLAEAGADIIAVARSEDDLGQLCKEVAGRGRSCLPVRADLSRVESPVEVAEVGWAWRGGVDLLVNGAGMMIRKDPPEVDPEDFDRLMAVNLRAPFFLSQEMGGRMRERGSGAIINVTSVAGEEVTGSSLIYQVSKAALIHLTRGFASRLAPEVRVNAVGPGYIRTSLNEEWLSIGRNARYVEKMTALQRVGFPDEVVGAVVFLASPAASYVTGHHLRVDGGWGI